MRYLEGVTRLSTELWINKELINLNVHKRLAVGSCG
jgi:hypothetical protein